MQLIPRINSVLLELRAPAGRGLPRQVRSSPLPSVCLVYYPLALLSVPLPPAPDARTVLPDRCAPCGPHSVGLTLTPHPPGLPLPSSLSLISMEALLPPPLQGASASQA